MKDREFGIILTVVSVIVIGTVLFFNYNKAEALQEGVSESPREGYVEKREYIQFEPIEISIPVTEYDFSDEEPMLITPDME